MTVKDKTSRYFTYIEPVIRAPIIKTYGSVIFTILALIVFIIFAIKPTLETIAVLQKELSLQKDTLSQATQKSEDLAQARKNYQQIDQNIKVKIQTAIPQNVNIATLIRSLEGATLATQASVSALQFQPITLQKQTSIVNLKELNFTFNVEGSFETIKTILDNLSSTERSISLDGISFSKIEGGNTILMSVSGKGYYLK